jgi:hypothetical protein
MPKTKKMEIRASFEIADSGIGSAQWLKGISGQVLEAYNHLMTKSRKLDAQGEPGVDLSLTFRARTLLQARDALLALAHDAELAPKTWTTVWTHEAPKGKRSGGR